MDLISIKIRPRKKNVLEEIKKKRTKREKVIIFYFRK